MSLSARSVREVARPRRSGAAAISDRCAVASQERFQSIDRQRRGKQESLPIPAAFALQRLELVTLLDALCERLYLERAAELHERAHERR